MSRFKFLFWLVIDLIIVTIDFCAGQYKGASIANEYFANTEILLDSINNQYNDFADIVMESDAYYNYEVSRNKLENI